MSHQLICSCLQLSPDHWPPDHYTLLGLDPQEVEPARIEHCVQERMERLRRYQLTHAEQVTEGMNRLAQALVCLTDPVARAAYDAKLFRRPVKRPTEPAGLHWSRPTDAESTLEQRSPSSSPLLLLAWILWLFVGLAGLAAVVIFFPAIQASYYGEPGKLGPVKRVTAKPTPLRPSERPGPPARE